MEEAVIVEGARTPVGKANKGTLQAMRSDDLAALTIKETLKRADHYDGTIDDVIIGCAMPEAEQGMNMARNIAGLAGLSYDVPGITINRYCSSGLESIAYGARQIQTGIMNTVIAGGAESMSMIPIGGNVIKPNITLIKNKPGYYMQMGHTAEEVASRFSITREVQDEFAAASHQKAAKAIKEGKFKEEIVSIKVASKFVNEKNQIEEQTITFDTDEGVRPDTNKEVLAGLKPVFSKNGTVTAGNASQMSDGAASVLLMNEQKARAEGFTPIAKFISYAVAGVEPEIMGVGPVAAIPKALEQAKLSLNDIGLIELNEAFASQAIRVIEALNIDPSIVNVNGGAIALGHPLGCTGTKLTLTLLHEMKRRKEQFGIVTMCIGGGMGAAGVFELM